MLLPAIALFLLAFLALWAALYRLLPPVWRAIRAVWAALARAILRRETFAVWYERGTTRLRPLHPYRTLLAILTLGFVTAALTGAAFLFLAELMQENSPLLARVDQAVWREARERRTEGATTFFLVFTLLGTGVGLGILALLITVVLVARGHRRWAAFLVLNAAGGGLLNDWLKVLFARARPDQDEALWRSSSYAFPSGHAMGSFVVFGAIVYLVMRASPSWRVRSAAVALACCLTGAISLSRIYLGVHWFSDIVAGLSAGLVWLATTTAVYEVHRRMRLLRATRAPGETATPGAAAGERARV
ncbi:MAG TPA: phosphatase PAP2 family protein [Vicinamibacteria bacterium]|nr:phosphatase PAP2 family protein [Vicinamibacteria bacterium]